MNSFDTVTELPGNNAHIEQVDALRTRYEWASGMCDDKEVLEVACGAGVGLGLLARNAKNVIGGDVDPNVLKYAIQHYNKQRNIQIMEMDACNMELADGSIDCLACFEAIYYFPSLNSFLKEAKRILRPGGVLLISSVNCLWHGFNPSPYSKKYYSIKELQSALDDAGFRSDFYVCFEDNPATFRRYLIGKIRQIAVALKIVPKTMKGKEFLKKLFYGNLEALPYEITENHGIPQKLNPYNNGITLKNQKYFYCAAKVST